MVHGTTSLAERAREVFENLGYSVERTGGTLFAVRGWKEVAVTPVEEQLDAPEDGRFHCFVTWHEEVETVRETVAAIEPGYDWAVIGVDAEEYEVAAWA